MHYLKAAVSAANDLHQESYFPLKIVICKIESKIVKIVHNFAILQLSPEGLQRCQRRTFCSEYLSESFSIIRGDLHAKRQSEVLNTQKNLELAALRGRLGGLHVFLSFVNRKIVKTSLTIVKTSLNIVKHR